MIGVRFFQISLISGVPFTGSLKFKIRLDSVVEQITHATVHKNNGENKTETERTEIKNTKIDIAYQTTRGGINNVFVIIFTAAG